MVSTCKKQHPFENYMVTPSLAYRSPSVRVEERVESVVSTGSQAEATPIEHAIVISSTYRLNFLPPNEVAGDYGRPRVPELRV